jgi:hypothetical protein
MTTTVSTSPPGTLHPTSRPGGLLVALLGLVVLASAITGASFAPRAPMSGLFFPGLLLSTAAMLVARRRLSTGRPSQAQRRGLLAGFAVEALGLLSAFSLLKDGPPRTLWLVVLLVVGLHFLPMRAAHGSLIVVLGVVCIVAAGLGLALPAVPFLAVAVVDGAAKTAVGARMLLR